MRVTADFFVAVVMRKLRAGGGFAYLVRRGADEAGAIFFLHRRRDGIIKLYGPAAQSLYGDETAADARLFTLLLQAEEEEKIVLYLEKELRFDPDIWLIEVENFDDLGAILHFVGE